MKEIKKQLLLGTKFLVKLFIYAVVIYLLTLFLKPQIEALTAIGSALVLNILGISSSWSGNLVLFSGQSAKIVELCTGSLELSILLGAILATEDRSWRNRLWGMVFATIKLYVINILRVGVTLASAVWYGWEFADLIHTVLFKFFLLFAIVGIYAIWYLWLSNRIQ